jgi:hypothetical protein
MSMPITEQILVRMLAVLLNSTSAGTNVYRSLEVAITPDITPAIVIIPEEESDSVFSASADLHDYMVNVEISARGDPWDISANKVAGELHKVLMSDAQLAALVTRIRKTSSKWEGEEADKTAGVLSMKYRITYLTSANDISSNSIL